MGDESNKTGLIALLLILALVLAGISFAISFNDSSSSPQPNTSSATPSTNGGQIALFIEDGGSDNTSNG